MDACMKASVTGSVDKADVKPRDGGRSAQIGPQRVGGTNNGEVVESAQEVTQLRVCVYKRHTHQSAHICTETSTSHSHLQGRMTHQASANRRMVRGLGSTPV